MAGHLRPLGRLRCSDPSCQRAATCELFNTFNAPLGRFCARHGSAALKRLEAREQQTWDRGIRNDGRT